MNESTVAFSDKHFPRYSDQALLDKYGLKSNDAILAEEKHMPIYDEITKLSPRYVAGGAAQNAARGAQVEPPFSNISISIIFIH